MRHAEASGWIVQNPSRTMMRALRLARLARYQGKLFGLSQSIELGLFARGDQTDSTQYRIEAATNAPWAGIRAVAVQKVSQTVAIPPNRDGRR